jgi:hypothetical protein
MRLIDLRASVATIVPVLMLCASTALAAPQAELWPRWQANDPTSREAVDYSSWSELLMRHVRSAKGASTRFDYASVTAKEREQLNGYVQKRASERISACNPNEQMAYWINLYNALTVQVVLEHWPVSTIRDIDISPGLFSSGPWGKKLITVEGEAVSLDDIEHRILRPIWMDPRIHYAVNCASIGCPDLRAKAFSADTLDADLDAAARSFINHPRAVMVEGTGVKVSSIYEWFKADFGGDDRAVIEHLRQYAEPALRKQLEQVHSVNAHHYDWTVNQP